MAESNEIISIEDVGPIETVVSCSSDFLCLTHPLSLKLNFIWDSLIDVLITLLVYIVKQILTFLTT